MADDILTTINDIGDMVEALNKKASAANETIKYYNDRLRGVGIEVWLTSSTPYPWLVGYANIQNGWQLSYSTGPEGYIGPLVLAPRDIRIKAVERLPELFEKIKAALAAQVSL